MNFKLTQDATIIRIDDGAFIPDDAANLDRQAYLVWLAKGGVPTAADPVSVKIADAAEQLLTSIRNNPGKLASIKLALGLT